MVDFKNKYKFDKRKDESIRIMQKYPERRPIIIEKHHKCEYDIDKNKYLVPKDMTLSQFMFVVRKRIKLDPSQSLFITVNHSLISGSKLLSEVYNDMKDEDGFLYITYTGENTFG